MDLALALLVAVLIVFLPGVALSLPLVWVLPDRPLHHLIILGGGVGLALNAIILMSLTAQGIPLTPTSLVGSYAVVGGLGLVAFWLARTPKGGSTRPWLPELPWSLALAALFAVVFLVRWNPLSGLAAPPGGDSIHHVAIVDLILRNESLPPTYEPYWPLETFTYHFGFHATAAHHALLSGLAPHESFLLLGPFLAALSSLAVYALVFTLTKSPSASFLAALTAGLLSVFPAVHLNWGRLPQLAGLILALTAMTLFLEAGWGKPGRVHVLVAGVAVAGLFLTHYRMFLLLAFGLATLLVLFAIRDRSLRLVRRQALHLGAVSVLALAIALPWVLNLAGSILAHHVVTSPFSTGSAPDVFGLQRVAQPLAHPSTFWLGSLSLVGAVGAALWRRDAFLVLTSWAGLSWFFSNRSYLPIPFAGLLDTVTWVTISFVFQAALIGLGTLLVLDGLRERRRLRTVVVVALAGSVALVGVLGAGVIPPDGDVLVPPNDRRAMHWIEENLPEDAVFATNVLLYDLERIVGPVDAGAWLTYFTGRGQLAPPLVSGLERPSFPEFRERAENLLRHESRVDSFPSFLYLRSLGATHLYLGSAGTGPMRPQDVANSPWYEVVYEEGNVTIARLVDLDALDPLELRGGDDWSLLQNGYSVGRLWEPNGTVVEADTFDGFRAEYPLYFSATGRYRLAFHLADFPVEDWDTGEPLSGLRFELDGAALVEHEYGDTGLIWLTREVEVDEAGTHTLALRERDPGLPFRISLGRIVLTALAS